MSKLFETTEINGMALSNRFVRSATWEGLAAQDGEVTPQLIEMMVNLAQGGVGLIITSHAYVRPEGQAGRWQIAVYHDRFIPGLCHMTAAVHKYESKIILQLAHAGVFTSEKITGQLPLAVSEPEEPGNLQYRTITDQDVQVLVKAYADGARRAKEAGFDGVQIHAAHGYLLSQFLSPALNRRTDQYGGDIHNRSRVLMQVYQAIRTVVGDDYPIFIKLNCQDFIKNGLTLEDSIWVGQMLSKEGLDAIEISGGLLTSKMLSPSRPKKPSEEEAPYYLNEARAFKNAVNVPVILVGGIRSFHQSEDLVTTGVADYISMSRPFIKEPDLINRWKYGDTANAECKSDNRCFRMGMSGNGISCDMKKET
ncbi:MAG TPA: NADH:flavin oxidoreductase [Syntrophomonadaceae bacterium]|nr:NADH:flavin oxidoreductase [Syntrophomonadaceae bacterium]